MLKLLKKDNRAADCKPRRPAMALEALDQDAQRIVFVGLCNPFEPWVAVNLSSTSRELWEATWVLQQQLRADHEATAALCRKTGMRNCTELCEAKQGLWINKGPTAAELALLGTLVAGDHRRAIGRFFPFKSTKPKHHPLGDIHYRYVTLRRGSLHVLTACV